MNLTSLPINSILQSINIVLVLNVTAIVVPLLVFLIVFWNNATKDGFNEIKIFDLIFSGVISAVLFAKVFYLISRGGGVYEFKFDVIGYVYGFYLVTVFLCKKWNWSYFRILDLGAISAVASVSMRFFVEVFIQLQKSFHVEKILIEKALLFVSLMVVYILLTKYRNSRIKSGLIFSIFSIVLSLAYALSGKNPIYLIFSVGLITISITNAYLRLKNINLVVRKG